MVTKYENVLGTAEPELRHVMHWCRESKLRNDWYNFAKALLPRQEARAIEANLKGGGSKECLRKVLEKWMDSTPDPSWGMIVDALTQIPSATKVVETINEKYKVK